MTKNTQRRGEVTSPAVKPVNILTGINSKVHYNLMKSRRDSFVEAKAMYTQKLDSRQHLLGRFTFNLKVFYSSIIICLLFLTTLSYAGETILQLFEKDFKKVVNSSRPAVVKVLATYNSSSEFANTIGKVTLFQQDISSGILLDNKGHIATTTFSMAPSKIEIVQNGKKLPAVFIGKDDYTDLVVLKANHKFPAAIRHGDSTKIDTGSLVLTIGSSQGNHPIVSFGIVSGCEILHAHPCAELLKINAPVSPGNSGGAVVNTSGEVVGMILAVLMQPNQLSAFTMQFPQQMMNKQIITFAVPMDTVKSVAAKIIKHGKVPRGFLGVDLMNKDEGVLVTRVFEDSPAHKSGLLPGDLIRNFNKQPIKTYVELQRRVLNSSPNSKVIIRVMREGSGKNYTIKLGER
ncbi:serine protease [Candidatus Poribacteria bacterium]|nr:serine protease [Candidatus Poribacteria bacterium]